MIRALLCDAFGHTYGPWRIVSTGRRWVLKRRVCTRCLRSTLERAPVDADSPQAPVTPQ